ncbi:unnamed protein product, partial [Nesidiocoris tenuis]
VVEQEQESTGTAVDLSGLELLSNTTIAQHENFHSSSPGSSNDSRDSTSLNIQADMGGLAVLCQAADYAMSQPNFIPVSSATASSSIVYRSSTVSTSTDIEDDSPVAEPPVLEPWSAAPQRLTPPLGPPTLTPNKKRSCPPFQGLPETKLTESDLKDFPISIMMYSGGHFVLAQVTDIKAPGIYEVIYLRNPRNRRPYILCTEELLSCAIREVKLDNMAIPAGTRVCSYWSQEYNFMYSGVVSALCKADDKFVFVEFDDGDDGKINRDEIRLLPNELNLTDYDPEPSSPLMGRRRRTSDSKSGDTPKTPPIKVKLLRPPLEEADEEMVQELSLLPVRHDITTDEHDGESHDNSAASEETSEEGSETRLDIKTIVAVRSILI